MTEILAEITDLQHRFGAQIALAGISATIPAGRITGLIGPDAAGKTTLLRLIAGLLRPSAGRVVVLGHDMSHDAALAHPDIGYMPQRFGLYEDLTVAENFRLFADLHGLSESIRAERMERLLRFTDLTRFTARLAGKLSGGMKQKLGLACALLSRPRLLLLDEPSVGVDPLSRRELWAIVTAMLRDSAGAMGVVWATAYLDEAARCDSVLLLHEGTLLADMPPADFTAPLAGRAFRLAVDAHGRRAVAVRARQDARVLDAVLEGDGVRLVLAAGAPAPEAAAFGALSVAAVPPRFEDAFVARLAGGAAPPLRAALPTRSRAVNDGPVIEVRNLVRRFGAFTAVDQVSFAVAPGEIFGLLGPNGAGKSTIFRMLCGLLRPSAGEARVAGQDLLRAASAARARIGYMAQRFSLYAELSVRENLIFFARIYGLRGARTQAAVSDALARFDLEAVAQTVSASLPLGLKQRLALAAALLHDPDILFLDEPTSGVDPLTRRDFWTRIGTLADAGVAVLVTSHFMDEAEYCDRLGIVSDGRLVAIGTPGELRRRARTADLPDPSLDDAFISLMQAAGRAAQAA